MSETAKHRDKVLKYCEGNGIDIGSSSDPVVPWAISMDLPHNKYNVYNPNRSDDRIQWRGDCRDLPFRDGMLDFLHCSHVLEDFRDWLPILKEWDRVLKIGGFIMVSVPDHERFREAVARGQGDNLGHKHESRVGELSTYLAPSYHIFHDDFVSDSPHEYSILFVGRKKSIMV